MNQFEHADYYAENEIEKDMTKNIRQLVQKYTLEMMLAHFTQVVVEGERN